jgi:hypothetical protein
MLSEVGSSKRRSYAAEASLPAFRRSKPEEEFGVQQAQRALLHRDPPGPTCNCLHIDKPPATDHNPSDILAGASILPRLPRT